MLEQLPSLLSAVVSDGFALFTLPWGTVGGFAAGAALSQIMRRRAEAARDILLEAIRAGEKGLPPTQIDEAVAIILRYFQAAQVGTAHLNLRLMADVIASKGRLGNLVADEFLHDADMIASLRREEIMLLAKLHHAWASEWLQKTKPEMQPEAAIRWATAQLVPSVFRDRQSLEATAGATTRTGLLKVMPAIGANTYAPTPLLTRLVLLASLEAAIAKEFV